MSANRQNEQLTGNLTKICFQDVDVEMEKGIDWSKVQDRRNLARDGLPRVLKLPIVPDQFTLIVQSLTPDTKLLDVGANTRRLENVIAERFGTITYKSLDPDQNLPHDYHDFSTVDESFDIVACMDVIEHLNVSDVHELVDQVHSVLRDDGVFFISTPNVHHPTWFRRDCTHKTYWHYNELAGILLHAGFKNLSAYRVGELDLKGRLIYPLYKPLIKMLDLDFATSIMIMCQK